jgi:putative FmdB family regulatory protein
MPTYEYKCASCFTTVEQERSLHSEAIAPTCCGGSMIRQWNSTAVHFKGTGFYKTGG